MSRVVGIDLGTTNSAVGYVGDDGLPTLIHNREGDYITPSVVLFEGDEATVGKQAKNSEHIYPLDVVSFVKRHMGNSEFTFIPATGDTQYPAEAVSSYILRYLADCASEYFGEPVKDVVITVPAYFGEAERTATKQAGQIAGLNVVRLINEPTAAAVSHSFKKGYRGNVVVYDLGGGTFDVTAMRVEGNNFTVLSTGGDKQLGGFDFDNALMEIVKNRFVAAGGRIDEYDDAFAAELRARVEETKIKLSLAEKARVHVSHGGVNERITVLRQEFDDAVRDLVTRTRYMLDDVLDQAGLTYTDIDKLLLVGGSTKMPSIRNSVQQWTGIVPDMSVNPDEAVALGAAILAATIDTSAADGAGSVGGAADITIQDVISVGLGVAVVNPSGPGLVNNVVVQPGTRIPCNVRGSSFQTVGATDTLKFQVTEGDEHGVDLKYVTVKAESQVRLPREVPTGHPLEVAIVATIDGQIEAELYDGESGALLCRVPVQDQRNLKPADVDRLRRVTKEVAIL